MTNDSYKLDKKNFIKRNRWVDGLFKSKIWFYMGRFYILKMNGIIYILTYRRKDI